MEELRSTAEMGRHDPQKDSQLSAYLREIKLKGSHPEYQYLRLAKDIMTKSKDDRAMELPRDQGIRCVQGVLHRYNLQKDGFPLLTTKDVAWKSVKRELLWFIKGDTNIKSLNEDGVRIWNDDAYRRYQRAVKRGEAPELDMNEFVEKVKSDPDFEKWGDLGPVYGAQWRRWKTPDGREVDQLGQLIDQLRSPIYRYRKSLLVSGWNPSFLPGNTLTEAEEVALPACHVMFQADVDEKNRLTLAMYQRSADMFLGVPFNIASYALLTHMLAQVSGLEAYQLIHFMENAHIYHRHFDAFLHQLPREPMPFPKLRLNPDIKNIDDFTMDDIKIGGYQHHERIGAKMVAVGGRIDL